MRLVDVLGKYDNFQDAYKKFEIISCMENSIKKDKDEFLSSGFMKLHPLDDIEYDDFEIIECVLSDIFITEKICPAAEILIKVLRNMEEIINAALYKFTVYYNADKYNKALKQTSDLISCLENVNLYDIYHVYRELTTEGFKYIGLELSVSTQEYLFKILYDLEVILAQELEDVINALEVREVK